MRLAPPSIDNLRDFVERWSGMPRIRRIGLGTGLFWVVLVLAYAAGFLAIRAGAQSRGTAFLDAMFFLVALTLPLILIWLACYLAEELTRQREVIAALAEVAAPMIDGLEDLRRTLQSHGPASSKDIQKAVHGAMLGTRGADPLPALERIEARQAYLHDELQALGQALLRTAPPAQAGHPPPAPPTPQPQHEGPAPTVLAAPEVQEMEPELPMLPHPDMGNGPTWPDLIRALDFPRDAEDGDGFRALRSALRHHSLAQMLQAAEDVLDLLSQEGVFMDNLALDPPDASAWRRFISGGRGTEVAGVGGIRDAEAMEITRGLMRTDPIFRDTALFLQRRFDVVLANFAGDASDGQLSELANTRSARAFALLARLSGSLD